MSKIPYQMVTTAEGTNLTVFLNGLPKTITKAHPRFELVESLVRSGANIEDIQMALDVAAEVDANLKGTVEVVNGQVLFDGEVIDGKIAEHIVQLLHERNPKWQHLVEFLRNLALNPSKKSRKSLYAWLQNANLTITKEGELIAYKGVQTDGTSCHSGPGVVNGVPMNGHLPNEIGNIVEMRREMVNDDRHVACSVGLHVGTYAYANNFGQRLLTVAVNPRDVVSVPKDCNGEKMRVCRYRVLELAPAKAYVRPTYRPYSEGVDTDENDGENDDRCTECGNLDPYCECCTECGNYECTCEDSDDIDDDEEDEGY